MALSAISICYKLSFFLLLGGKWPHQKIVYHMKRLQPSDPAIKSTYFTFVVAWGAFAQFLPLIFRSSGLHVSEVAVLYALFPVTSCVVRPFLTALADARRCHREFFIVFVLTSAILLNVIVSLPHVPETVNANLTQDHNQTDVDFVEYERFSYVFWLIAVLGSLLFLTWTTAANVLVTLSMFTLESKNKTEGWGRHRLWGTIGEAVSAVSTGALLDAVGGSWWRYGVSRYSISMYIVAVFCCLSAGIVFRFVRNTEKPHAPGSLRTKIVEVFRNAKMVLFSSMLVLLGAYEGFIFSFRPWFLAEIGASSLLVGMTQLAISVPEIGLFFWSGPILKRFGYEPCVAFIALVYAVRLLAFRFLYDPWLALCIDALACLGRPFTVVIMATLGFSRAPHGAKSTIIAVMTTLYIGIGRSVGALCGGLLYSGLGSRTTFTILSVCSFLTFIYFVGVTKAIGRWCPDENDKQVADEAINESKETEEIMTNGKADEPDGTALTAEEEEESVLILSSYLTRR